DLSFNLLSGALPRSITQLRKLSSIHMTNNSFYGSLPSSLGLLSPLQLLDLSFNRFSGPLPLTITQLTRLSFLDLSANSFSGLLPEAITALTALQHINLVDNRDLTGVLPPGLGALTALTMLAVKNTSLICPSTDAACDVPQTLLSPFCIQCPNYCRHCIQYGTSPSPPAPAGSQPSYFPEKPLPPPSPAAPPLPPMGRPINRPQLVTTTTVSSSKGGLSGGAIAAIVIGLLIVLITAAGLAYIVITHKPDAPDQQGSFRPSTCIFSYGVYPFDAAVGFKSSSILRHRSPDSRLGACVSWRIAHDGGGSWRYGSRAHLECSVVGEVRGRGSAFMPCVRSSLPSLSSLPIFSHSTPCSLDSPYLPSCSSPLSFLNPPGPIYLLGLRLPQIAMP
ncbi:unnamed protein product, partial [Closterium sp. NIES-65]